MTIMSNCITLLGALGIIAGLTLRIANWSWLLTLIAVPMVIAFGIAPYKLYKEKNDMLRKLMTPKLQLEIEEQPEVTGNLSWWHLIVRNPSSSPVESCYGQLLSFEPNKSYKPYQGLRLPWSSWVTRDMERHTIPGNSRGTLDFVVVYPRFFSVVALSTEEGKRTNFNQESPGSYEAEIQVGSEKEAFCPTKIKVKIVYFEDGRLTIEKVNDD